MTTTSAKGVRRRAPGSRLPRGTLTPDLIVKAALTIADAEGLDGLTFQALGRALSAHPTAIYRHFRNKDELMLALADALHKEALDNMPPPSADWAHDLMEIAIHTHEAFLRHPHVGAISAPRPSLRENEFRSVERKLDCMRRAGLNEPDACRYHRVFADLVHSYSAMDAGLAALPADVRTADLVSWQADYARLPASTYPNIAHYARYFVALDDPDNFRTAVQAMIDAIRAAAERGSGSTAR